MRTPKEWLKELSIFGHSNCCVCGQCKNGTELFLTEKEISRIQEDAIRSVDPKISKREISRLYWGFYADGTEHPSSGIEKGAR